MQTNWTAAAIIALIALATAPGIALSGEPAGPMSIETKHFTFHLYDDMRHEDALKFMNSLEGEYERLMKKIRPTPMPKVDVHLFDEFETMARDGPNPEPQGIGFVTRDDEGAYIWLWVMDSSELDALVARFKHEQTFRPADGRLAADPVLSLVHEFAHLVTTYVNDDFGNNPRWLWESIALYEAGQVFDPALNVVNFDDLKRPFGTMNSDTSLYLVGGNVTEFIVKRWGYSVIPRLIETLGDTEQVLGLNQLEFEAAFWQYIGRTYYQIENGSAAAELR